MSFIKEVTINELKSQISNNFKVNIYFPFFSSVIKNEEVFTAIMKNIYDNILFI